MTFQNIKNLLEKDDFQWTANVKKNISRRFFPNGCRCWNFQYSDIKKYEWHFQRPKTSEEIANMT